MRDEKNVMVHRQGNEKAVMISDELFNMKNAQLSNVQSYIIEIMFLLQRGDKIAQTERHVVLSCGVVDSLSDEQSFFSKYYSSLTRQYKYFFKCTKCEYELHREKLYELPAAPPQQPMNNADNVYAQYQIVRAYGCRHVITGCTLKCPICHVYYQCAECHDQKSNHSMESSSVRTIQCLKCLEEQPFAGQCRKCKLRFGNYCCGICKISVYQSVHQIPVVHCCICGKCHKYVENQMEQCKICKQCFIKQYPHHCQAQVCSVCLEPGNLNGYYTRCHHFLHKLCAEQLVRNEIFACPICRKLFVTGDDERRVFKKMIGRHGSYFLSIYDEEKKVLLKCNDCQKTYVRVRHPSNLYFCDCGSFNCEMSSDLVQPDDSQNCEGPVPYQYSTQEQICKFLLKRHQDEIAAQRQLDKKHQLLILKYIFDYLQLTCSAQDCGLIGLVYNDQIRCLTDLKRAIDLLRALQCYLSVP